MGTKRKKYQRGSAVAFMSRTKALRKLQLSLPDFRMLCIFKGIYPVEPPHRKKVNKGGHEVKTYYNLKDIQFLSHDNLIHKFRENKVYIRRLKKARAKGYTEDETIIRENKPVYVLTPVIRERYPSFIDALRDLDDTLNLCFVFATFPSSEQTHQKLIHLCQRRTVEFQHLVMSTKALRKVFVSIKGIYYQADVKGETITWAASHKRGYDHPRRVDFKVMKTFAEYYSILLGHINIKLFSDAGYVYPPQLADEPVKTESDMFSEDDRVTGYLATLALPIKRSGQGAIVEEEEEDDAEVEEMNAVSADDPDSIEKSKLQAQSVKKLQNLFKGMKFFLNREVPLEDLTFVIRSCSGQVSWDSTVGAGSTYQESDQSITHHIIDRPVISDQKITRTYLQPQWVFDCLNARAILPAKDYFPGVVPPPHLSPFVEEKEGDYIPEDKVKFLKRSRGELVEDDDEEAADGDDSDDNEGKEDSSDDDDDVLEENDEDEEEGDDDEEEEGDEEEDDDVPQPPSKKMKKGDKKGQEDESTGEKIPYMAVKAGTVKAVNKKRLMEDEAREEKRLAEMMIPKKHRRLYNKIMYSRKKLSQESRKLQEKKDKISKEKKATKKSKNVD